MNSSTLSHLLLRWEEACAQGQDLPAEQLCPGRPDLAAELALCIEALRRMRALASDTEVKALATVAPPSTADACPTDVPATMAPPSSVASATDVLATVAPTAGEARPPAFGSSPPGYEIIAELGRGGMGVVYKARQVRLNRVVALKMVLSGAHAAPEEHVRFLAEAEAIAAVEHPGIVQVHDFGTHDGLPFFSLEFCPGGSLAGKLAGTPMPPRESAQIIERVARAVQAAHQRGIVHRDLKPANVLLAEDGSPKVSDFGLAKRVDTGAGLTATGAVMGTPSYMAPEQAQGHKDLGPAADVYALGAILYDCLTGRPPFLAATVFDTLLQVVHDEPLPPRRLNPAMPADLETVCLKCLHKEPARRYSSAGELADDLHRWLAGEPITARPVGVLERGWRWCRRNPWVASLAAAVVLSLCAGVAVSTWFAVAASANAHEAAAKADLAEEKSQQADDNARQARTTAVFAGKQRDLALEAFNTLLLAVHEASGDSPALRQMKDRLVDTAEKGLARLADRNDPALTPDLGLAETRNRLGVSFTMLGRLTAARREHEAALAIVRAVLAAEPTHPRARVVLVSTCADLARVCAAGLDRAATRHYAEQALRSGDVSPVGQSDRDILERARGTSCESLATMAQVERDWSTARLYARKMLEINRQWAAGRKDVAGQVPLARAHAMLGGVETEAGNLAAAAVALREAVRLSRSAAARKPDDPDIQLLLSGHLVALGKVNRQRGDMKSATADFQEALAVQRKLLVLFPHVVVTQSAVIDTCTTLGQVSLEAKDLGWARQYLNEASSRLRKLQQEDPTNAAYRRAMVQLQRNLGDACLGWQGFIAARNHYREALALAGGLAKADPADAHLQALVFASEVRLARVNRELGQHTTAARNVRAARDLVKRLPANPEADVVKQRAELEKWPAAPLKSSDRLLVNSLGIDLVLIEAGKFQMGARNDPEAIQTFFNRKLTSEGQPMLALFAAEQPRHHVTISRRFYLGATEVTRGQFRAFVTATGYRTDAEKDGRGFGNFNPTRTQAREYTDWRLVGEHRVTDDHPVAGVSWNDATAFCEWLSRKEKVRYRLPTEAEWEYACRAGTTTRFWTGDEPATLLRGANVPDITYREGFQRLAYEWVDGRDGYSGLAPVGSFAANPWGLYDMHGNVWEWCADGYDASFYQAKAVTDPIGPADRPERAMRGGCFM
jgi:serine/threonine-protein kinase